MFNRRTIISKLAGLIGLGSISVAAEPSAPNRRLTDAERAERLEVQLAGCATAALGCNEDPAKPDQYGWSPSYQDVLDLRGKFEAAVRLLADRAPDGQVIALYPCGCSALGNFNAGAMPKYCGQHGDAEHTDRCRLVLGSLGNYPIPSRFWLSEAMPPFAISNWDFPS